MAFPACFPLPLFSPGLLESPPASPGRPFMAFLLLVIKNPDGSKVLMSVRRWSQTATMLASWLGHRPRSLRETVPCSGMSQALGGEGSVYTPTWENDAPHTAPHSILALCAELPRLPLKLIQLFLPLQGP